MKSFNKPAKTFAEQIELLKARGMQFANEQDAQFYLEQINYYRLGAYWLPFEHTHSPHCFKPDTSFEQVLELYVFDRELRLLILDAIERLEVAVRTRFAYELAQKRPKKHLTAATKSNGISISMPYWDERFAAIGKEYPDVRTDKYHIDILTANFVRHPDWFDVVVGSNLFGDILSDLGPACTGTIAIAPSANLNPERKFPSLFEPVHGSAPDIYGQQIANPIGQIWAGSMMLEHLGYPEAAADVMRAIETVLAEGPHTPDLSGKATTSDLGKAIAEVIASR